MTSNECLSTINKFSINDKVNDIQDTAFNTKARGGRESKKLPLRRTRLIESSSVVLKSKREAGRFFFPSSAREAFTVHAFTALFNKPMSLIDDDSEHRVRHEG